MTNRDLTLLLVLLLSVSGIAQPSADNFLDTMKNISTQTGGYDLTKDVDKRSFEFVPIVVKDKPVTFIVSRKVKNHFIKENVKTTLSEPFEMQRTEVTQLQFKIVMDAYAKDQKEAKDKNRAGTEELYKIPSPHFYTEGATYNRPMENVSMRLNWDGYAGIELFLKKLNELDKKYTYRLPTNEEWEYAARAGSPEICPSDEKLPDYAWYEGNSRGRTFDVALKAPNELGLYDMYGNVKEMTGDVSNSDFTMVNGTGSYGTVKYYKVRGGSYDTKIKGLCPIEKGYISSLESFPNVGFRLVRTLK